MIISNNMVEYSYEVAKQVYAGKLTRSQGKELINNNTGMKIGSANDYITVFLNMICGKEYHRTINFYATNYFLENIRMDYGEELYKKALNATDKHIKYYRSLGHGNLRIIEELLKELKLQV